MEKTGTMCCQILSYDMWRGLHLFSLNHCQNAPSGFHPDCDVEMHMSTLNCKDKNSGKSFRVHCSPRICCVSDIAILQGIFGPSQLAQL